LTDTGSVWAVEPPAMAMAYTSQSPSGHFGSPFSSHSVVFQQTVYVDSTYCGPMRNSGGSTGVAFSPATSPTLIPPA